MTIWLKLFFVSVLLTSSTMSSVTERELIFTPIDSGDMAILHLNGDEMFLINTGDEESLKSVENTLNQWPDKKLKGILITSSKSENCGNLEKISKSRDVEQIYVSNENEMVCSLSNEDYNVFSLKQQNVIALSNDFYIKYIAKENSENGNIVLSNDVFSVYWYETDQKLNGELKGKVQLIYIPSYISANMIQHDEINKIDPQMAIINEKNDPQRNRQMHDLFQESWVETYFLKKFIAIHISIYDGDYDVYLERLNK
ncbi:hypothetical protein J2R98_000635 [Alkalibacillus filiformis]|uniref:Uncharacterized protein n=1 Tax=Alkalibacillus filiformis TaxID=200990 RepID=A0ABU0DQX3_9BACI|nr:hypothetical protein [Alkalibacillus filiformis]MDQ0350832.1 hypothetical protein [Alkalibacillus filiformis]